MLERLGSVARAAKLVAIATVCVAASSSQTIELTPGQWRVDHTLSAPDGSAIHTDQSNFCLSQEDSSLTFDQILDELNFAQCRTSNLTITASSGRADVTCIYPDAGDMRLTGTMEATYSKEAYRIEARINETGTEYLGVGRRVGDCAN
ncbi:MAG: DUF3617 family protein [Pseudomonadota bacterium]